MKKRFLRARAQKRHIPVFTANKPDSKNEQLFVSVNRSSWNVLLIIYPIYETKPYSLSQFENLELVFIQI